jgi:hypothetical protein
MHVAGRILIWVLFVAFWIALTPPLFTHGACTSEFDAYSGEIEHDRPSIATLAAAESYLATRRIPYEVVTAERCERSPPREVDACTGGPIVLAAMPIHNRVCRFYRDDRVLLQLGFNRALQLVRIQTDMKPFRVLKSETLGFEIDWAK